MRRDLGALADREHDLLVVGGGIVGAAAAWDAAQRGLSVALVEAGDFCSGASWNSLKTIHGGLRHLQRLDVGGLRESMRERRALLTIATPLVRPLEFLVPAYGHGPRGIEALALGVRLADLLTPDRNRGVPPEARLAPSRRLSAPEVLKRVPGLESAGLTGGVAWNDAQVLSSERLVLAFLESAVAEGAVLANHVEVASLQCHRGRVHGVTARDHEGGAGVAVRARCVLNAAGPALDRVLAAAGLARLRVPVLEALNLGFALPPPVTAAVGARIDGRFLFLVPWSGVTLVGTDYAPAETPSRRDAFLRLAQRAFPWAGLAAERLCLVHRGRVPGQHAGALWSRHRIVDHEVTDGVGSLVSIVSVKLTTARGVAQQAVDRVVARLGRPSAPCRTAHTPLRVARPEAGSLAARARHAVREEMGAHLDDLLLRRLDVATTGPPDPGAVDAVLDALASERGLAADAQQAERARLARALAGIAPKAVPNQ